MAPIFQTAFALIRRALPNLVLMIGFGKGLGWISPFINDDDFFESRLDEVINENEIPAQVPLISKQQIHQSIGLNLQSNELPSTSVFEIAGRNVSSKIIYTLDQGSQVLMDRILGQYRPDYAAFVAIDADTGEILTMSSRIESRLKGRSIASTSENLTLRATFPAASVFKIVTAGAVIDTGQLTPESKIAFNGADHTLYKKNVVSTKENRWTRRISLREAFGSSINTVFGKLGLFYAGPEVLRDYAERFFFNQAIPSDLPIQTGYSRFTAENPWSVASAASGFTNDTTMSPIQGAMIAAAIANDGRMMEPFVVQEIESIASQESLYRAAPRVLSQAIEPESAKEMRKLFEQTVVAGTSRAAFRQVIRHRAFDDVEFGGKTGSLTGRDPKGKCDWFVGYARWSDRKVAVAALTVNEDKWKVKSATLAQQYFTELIGRERNIPVLNDRAQPRRSLRRSRPPKRRQR